LELLKRVKEQFKDKQAKQAAGSKLARIRMGDAQFFNDFLDDFEYLLGIAGEFEFISASKIIGLNSSINTTLKRNLVILQLQDDDYDTWVSMVRTVAGRLEALPEYRPRGTKNTVTWFLKEPGLVSEAPAPRITKPGIDRDGDVIMEGVNKLEIKILIAAIKVISTGSSF
jgi:hypothetical protein